MIFHLNSVKYCVTTNRRYTYVMNGIAHMFESRNGSNKN